MPKNIVICCDGTGQEFGELTSNVIKLYSTLTIDAGQVGYYHPGVGTMAPQTARNWLEKKWDWALAMGLGAGLLQNVEDAYCYLMDIYEPGDRVYLFGFSRGAFTARAVAGVIYMFGLLHPRNHGLAPYAIRMYAQASREAGGMKETLDVADHFKATFSRDCPIYFEGLWDTVSSVGWITDPVVLPYSARNPIASVLRHAVSIDERRCYFRQNLWGAPFSNQDMKQVWFSGTHEDIGGGLPEAESGLSQVTLEWMLHEAAAAGLKIDGQKAAVVLGKERSNEAWMPRYIMPDAAGPIHPSLTGFWWILEFLPHRSVDTSVKPPVVRWRIPLGKRRQIPDGSRIYESSKERVEWRPSFEIEKAVEFPARADTVSGAV